MVLLNTGGAWGLVVGLAESEGVSDGEGAQIDL